MYRPPMLVIIGSTATGKSDVAVDIALKYGGEIISADSRQVFKHLNHTTGKIDKKEMKGVPHHLLDIVEPGESYTVHDFVETVTKVIQDIYSRGSFPILVGGTGFYIEAILFEGFLPEVPRNEIYRKQIEGKETEELLKEIEERDKETFERIDKKNHRRVIRALEIIRNLGKVPKQNKLKRYNYQIIGCMYPMAQLKKRIEERLDLRFEKMIIEINTLLERGITSSWLDSIGLECRHISYMLTKDITREETHKNLLRAILAYAKRQNTWWKRYPEAKWFYAHEHKKMCQFLDTLYKR